MSLLNFGSFNRLPSILQSERAECGLVCLAMVAGYYGHQIDINTLRMKYALSSRGTNLKTLIQIADRMYLSSRPLRLEIDDLEKLRLPAILHWDMNHFVVLKRIAHKKIVVHDPAVGVRIYKEKEFGRHFTGVAVELNPTSEFTQKIEERKLTFSHLWQKVVGLKRSLIQLFILSILLEIFALVSPFFSQLAIDDVVLSTDLNLLKIIIIGFFIIVIIKQVTQLLRSYVIMHFSNLMSFQFAVNVYRHLLRLPLEYFSKRHLGDILSRFGSTEHLKEFLTSGIIAILIDGILLIGTLIMMLIYSQLLTGVVLIAVVIYGISRLSLYRPIRQKSEEMLMASAKEQTNFIENISAIQGIKLFGKETDRISLWQNYLADVINTGIRVQKQTILIQLFNGLLSGIEQVLIIYLGIKAVLDNQFSVGMLVAFLSYKDNFLSRAFSLLDKSFEFKLLDIHLTRLADIAFAKQEKHADGLGFPAVISRNKSFFETKNLGFRYSEDSPFLFQNVNLILEPQESIAIIGPSGCGKSTLLKVLLSLLSPVEGEILMQGTSINKAGYSAYRERIGAVLQDDSLLSGTIADNISFFDPQFDQERIEKVADLAAIHFEIMAMPMQYQTLVGNMGTALSGGQVQRILLTRALYKNPALIVLDEATSSLDIANEQRVNESIRELKIARIIVSHRPNTAELADRILLLTPNGLIEQPRKTVPLELFVEKKYAN